MNSKNIKMIPKERVGLFCFNCLKETSNLNKIIIPEIGYGGGFDGFGTLLYLCQECFIESNPEMWSMEEKPIDEYFTEYVYDEEMWNYIDKLPLESKELVCNTLCTGFNASNKLDPQDYIDYSLDELPYEKCKEYGLFAPEEIKAFNERYPKCEYVYNEIWDDGSKGSSCALKNCVFGEYGGIVGLNLSDKCYKCKCYKERVTPIKDIKGEEKEEYEIKVRASYFSNQDITIDINALKIILKDNNRYKDFSILEKPISFNKLFKNKNFDIVQLHSIQIIKIDNKEDIVGFCGVCKWEDNKLTSLDYDTYTDNMLVYGYNEFNNEEENIIHGIDILVGEDW